MKIHISKKALPYKALIVIILIVSMHYFNLFIFPSGIEFILYTNRSKWIAPVAIFSAWICMRNHSARLRPYLGFIRRYLYVLTISVLIISIYTTIAYPANPLITTYGFASYYLYAFLAVPILYIYIEDDGFDNFFVMINYMVIIMYVITILNGVWYMRTGGYLFSAGAASLADRNGKARISAGPLGFPMIIYNFYKLYCFRNSRDRRNSLYAVSFVLGILSIFVTGNSRVQLVTLLLSIGSLILLGDGTKKKKLFSLFIIIAGIIFILYSGVVSKLLASFSSVGEYAGSSIARVGAYQYYWSRFLDNPIFANGFVGDENYYDIVHGNSGIYFQTVLVRFYYDDVGIAGQLALLGIFIIPIIFWLLFRMIKIAIHTCNIKGFPAGKLALAFTCYFVSTMPTLIIFDLGRVIVLPIIIATVEYLYADRDI